MRELFSELRLAEMWDDVLAADGARDLDRKVERMRDELRNSLQRPAQPLSQAPLQTPAQAPSQTPAQAPLQTPAQAPLQTLSQAPLQTLSQAPLQTLSQAPLQTPSQAQATSSAECPAPRRAVPVTSPLSRDFAVKRFALFDGEELLAGEKLFSRDEAVWLRVTAEGNAQIESGKSYRRAIVWSSETGGVGVPPHVLRLTAGNLTLADSAGEVTWSSWTAAPGPRRKFSLTVGFRGNLMCLCDGDGRVLWCVNEIDGAVKIAASEAASSRQLCF